MEKEAGCQASWSTQRHQGGGSHQLTCLSVYSATSGPTWLLGLRKTYLSSSQQEALIGHMATISCMGSSAGQLGRGAVTDSYWHSTQPNPSQWAMNEIPGKSSAKEEEGRRGLYFSPWSLSDSNVMFRTDVAILLPISHLENQEREQDRVCTAKDLPP